MHERHVLVAWAGVALVVLVLAIGGPFSHALRPPRLLPPANAAAAAAATGEVTAPPSNTQQARSTAQPTPTRQWITGAALGQAIGGFHYRWFPDGSIEPDASWVQANIRTETMPIIGPMTCHRAIFAQLRLALREIQREGLSSLIDPTQYAGCYVPRFIDRNPDSSISMHAFGIAFDLNTTTNQLGTAGDMDPRIVAIMKNWGFAWGGDWTTRPDPMHFELYALLKSISR